MGFPRATSQDTACSNARSSLLKVRANHAQDDKHQSLMHLLTSPETSRDDPLLPASVSSSVDCKSTQTCASALKISQITLQGSQSQGWCVLAEVLFLMPLPGYALRDTKSTCSNVLDTQVRSRGSAHRDTGYIRNSHVHFQKNIHGIQAVGVRPPVVCKLIQLLCNAGANLATSHACAPAGRMKEVSESSEMRNGDMAPSEDARELLKSLERLLAPDNF
eukprot:1147437-Pelagomonas_calceolata.AAC.1